MAGSSIMTVSGLSELHRGLEQAPELARERLADDVAVSTAATENRVRSLAPSDTGNLRRAIDSSARGLQGRVTIEDDAYYWRFIEYGYYRGFSTLGGRRYIAARPFVRTATELETEPFVQRVEAAAKLIARDLSVSRFL
jgi:HK97 gp10 family phage protein